jgi:hypothetical protein
MTVTSLLAYRIYGRCRTVLHVAEGVNGSKDLPRDQSAGNQEDAGHRILRPVQALTYTSHIIPTFASGD